MGRKDAADKGQKGTALLMATENITVKGANFNIKGDAVLQAGDKLNLDTLKPKTKNIMSLTLIIITSLIKNKKLAVS